jgi:hypothetical protein
MRGILHGAPPRRARRGGLAQAARHRGIASAPAAPIAGGRDAMSLLRFLLRFLLLLPLAAAAGWAATAPDEIEFSAVVVLPGKISVRLVEKATGTAAWVPIGESFAGYTVSAFEPKEETVVLVKAGVTGRVRLNTAKVKEGKPLDPAVVEQQKRAILNNLRQLGAAADQYYLEHGTNHATLEQLVGPTAYVKAIVPVDGEDYSQIEFSQGKALTITTPNGVTVSYQQ